MAIITKKMFFLSFDLYTKRSMLNWSKDDYYEKKKKKMRRRKWENHL
jgi:hypothetical protein